jgi:hypothetical protein
MNYLGLHHYIGPVRPARRMMATDLLREHPIDTGEWQSMDTTGSKAHWTRELENVTYQINVPTSVPEWAENTTADLPWAENHFGERVDGEPLNPPPSHVDWPYAVRGNGDHTTDDKFDHTYPERFWPKYATDDVIPHQGIRFPYGDLQDVVMLLAKSPHTRQAYLPVWFPEDTGGHVRFGARVPCTLGYHFMIRYGIMSCRYYIRSCDIKRHFHNDIYLAGRLLQWMTHETHRNGGLKVVPGILTTHIGSLHTFVGDEPWLRGIIDG